MVWKQKRAGYGFILPALLVLFFIGLYPLLYQIYLSFTDWYLLRSPVPIFHGLAGFERLLNDEVVWESLSRTLIWTIGTVIIEFLLGLTIALLLNRPSRLNGILSGLILLPWVAPSIVIALTWRWLLDSESGTVHAVHDICTHAFESLSGGWVAYAALVAADTPNGLVVPVIKDADKKSIAEIAQEASALAKKARESKLSPAEMQGGCFSISSLGGIGGTLFTPIINAPEVAILGVSKSEYKPKWSGKSFEPRLMLPLSLSYDHRVVDGAAGARFITALGQALAAQAPAKAAKPAKAKKPPAKVKPAAKKKPAKKKKR